MTFRFHELASQELDEAFHYYENDYPGRGKRFMERVEACVQRICQHPLLGAEEAPGIRRMMVDRFPLQTAVSPQGWRRDHSRGGPWPSPAPLLGRPFVRLMGEARACSSQANESIPRARIQLPLSGADSSLCACFPPPEAIAPAELRPTTRWAVPARGGARLETARAAIFSEVPVVLLIRQP